MELIPKPFSRNLNRYWRRRRYERIDGARNGRKKIQVTRFHGAPPPSPKRLRATRRLRIIGLSLSQSPVKLWTKVKHAYINMMLSLAGNVGDLNTNNVFGGKRIPKSRQIPVVYSGSEIEEKLIFEIYKALQMVPAHHINEVKAV
ncbi:hypothetical protein L484_027091 [Morus notabilis]|uniref:Uncharacterized protein n=1 Tax=Morus notabilis TaxID=981085 RepID=W9SBI3_9ROSA|nr:uncharacterized protein LOC21409718 [Morus notabilis]EXC20537.1 hypothetical protein L484_027091 [Morus notabilis]